MIRPPPLALLGLLAATLPAFGSTFTVDRTDDVAAATACAPAAANDCSLRGAIIAANANAGPDTIDVPAGTYTLTTTGRAEDMAATGDLDITDDLTLTGAGAVTTIIDGGALDRVFHSDPFGTGIDVTIDGVTIQNGSSIVISFVLADGGAVRNGTSNTASANTAGTLTIKNSVIQASTTERAGGGIANAGTLVVMDTTVTGNTGNNGGGLFQEDTGAMTLTRSTVSGNTGSQGGGMFFGAFSIGADPMVTIADSTISGNTAPNAGGIFYNRGTLTVRNTTISGNTGKGIFAGDTDATLRNCTIAGNTSNGVDGPVRLGNTIVAGNSGSDCLGTITSDGHNLIVNVGCTITGDTTGNLLGIDPELAALADNGGPTLTRAIASDSPAFDAGDPATPGSGGTACEATDQRGIARPQPVGGKCDIGAFELVSVATTTTTTSTTTTSTSTITTTTSTVTTITGSSSSTVSSLTTTSTSSTTSTSAGTPTTTPTTSTSPPTTTTTLASCAGIPAGPTFASIACRLTALRDRLNGESGLGTFQLTLVLNVERAQRTTDVAATACAAPKAKAVKKAKKRLQQAATALKQYARRLSGFVARKKLDEVLRESLIDAATPIVSDLRTLRGNLQCPGDVAGIPRAAWLQPPVRRA
jgi:hypothetical protein